MLAADASPLPQVAAGTRLSFRAAEAEAEAARKLGQQEAKEEKFISAVVGGDAALCTDTPKGRVASQRRAQHLQDGAAAYFSALAAGARAADILGKACQKASVAAAAAGVGKGGSGNGIDSAGPGGQETNTIVGPQVSLARTLRLLHEAAAKESALAAAAADRAASEEALGATLGE